MTQNTCLIYQKLNGWYFITETQHIVGPFPTETNCKKATVAFEKFVSKTAMLCNE